MTAVAGTAEAVRAQVAREAVLPAAEEPVAAAMATAAQRGLGVTMEAAAAAVACLLAQRAAVQEEVLIETVLDGHYEYVIQIDRKPLRYSLTSHAGLSQTAALSLSLSTLHARAFPVGSV